MEATKTEITFYQDGNVIVTQSRFVTASKTYAMRNISSVFIYEIIKSRKLPIVLLVIGVLLLTSDSARLFGFCLLAAGIGLLLVIKNEFAVRISTNAGESNSIVSRDKAYIQQIVNALNEAIIYRG